MTTLAEIIQDLHREAEDQPFATRLVTGTVTTAEYLNYLYQLLLIYDPIEFGCQVQGFFTDLPGLYRLPRLYQDYLELAGPGQVGCWLPETLAYHQYLLELLNDPARRHRLQAHLYIRHAGDMSGGQTIARQVPGSGRFYAFEDLPALKSGLLARLDPRELGAEARTAFRWNITLLEALGRWSVTSA